jgi:hypothetical protein
MWLKFIKHFIDLNVKCKHRLPSSSSLLSRTCEPVISSATPWHCLTLCSKLRKLWIRSVPLPCGISMDYTNERHCTVIRSCHSIISYCNLYTVTDITKRQRNELFYSVSVVLKSVRNICVPASHLQTQRTKCRSLLSYLFDILFSSMLLLTLTHQENPLVHNFVVCLVQI